MKNERKDFVGVVPPTDLFAAQGSQIAPAPLNLKKVVGDWDQRVLGADLWLSNLPAEERALAKSCWQVIQDYALRLIAIEQLAMRFPKGDLRTAITKMVKGDFKVL